MALDVVVAGALGRMGREITRMVLEDKRLRLAGCIEARGHPNIGEDIGYHTGAGNCGVTLEESIEKIKSEDFVLIDFTAPEATLCHLEYISKTTSRIVIGTTGFKDSDMEKVREASGSNAVMLSANMSLGVNFLFYLTEIAAKKLGSNFDIEIIESHHKFKKDAPSGTAKRLAEIASNAIGTEYSESVIPGRDEKHGARKDKEIGVHSVRGGDIVGNHTVLFAGMGESLELTHINHSRKTLAAGAVSAAKWLAGKDAGLYSMRDLLGI